MEQAHFTHAQVEGVLMLEAEWGEWVPGRGTWEPALGGACGVPAWKVSLPQPQPMSHASQPCVEDPSHPGGLETSFWGDHYGHY